MFIGRDFLQQAAVAAGAGSEHGLDIGHIFLLTKLPSELDNDKYTVRINKLWLPYKTFFTMILRFFCKS